MKWNKLILIGIGVGVLMLTSCKKSTLQPTEILSNGFQVTATIRQVNEFRSPDPGIQLTLWVDDSRLDRKVFYYTLRDLDLGYSDGDKIEVMFFEDEYDERHDRKTWRLELL